MANRWQVVTLFYDGGIRVRCTHRFRTIADLCLSARSVWRDLTDPGGRYAYDLRQAARKAEPITITPDELDRAMVAYRRGARMTSWEECITHDADRTLSGLRAALTEIGFHVARRDSGSSQSQNEETTR